jgi:hypothetical protein
MTAPTKPKPPENVVIREGDTVEPRKRRKPDWFGWILGVSLAWAIITFAVVVLGAGGYVAFQDVAFVLSAEPDQPMSVEAETDQVIDSISRKVDTLREKAEACGEDQPASRGPIRWAANQWNLVGAKVNRLLDRAEKQGHVDVHVDVKGPKGKYTLLQFDVEVRLPK